MTKKFLNTETNNWVEYKEDDTQTDNNFYNTKIEQIRMVFRQHGWIVESHQPFYGQPDMVPCVLSINYDQVGPEYFTATYWIQTADNEFGNDVRIYQGNATNGSTDLIQSVTEQMKNNFHWFLINTNR